MWSCISTIEVTSHWSNSSAKQQTGRTINSIISIDGNYYFQLPAGRYNVMVSFPDGSHKTVNNLVQSGAAENIDFVY
ncbi:MAG TPA: hypothetical protein VE619_05985 [Nitrososphaeraceae archaeon]|nr:hypothetical protein [Nitrososphaeraceae archaeon]